MNLAERYLKLPIRLRRAMWVWATLGLTVSALPATVGESLGMAANAGFWVLLPLLCVAPFWSTLMPTKAVIPVRRRERTQARRRSLAQANRVARAA